MPTGRRVLPLVIRSRTRDGVDVVALADLSLEVRVIEPGSANGTFVYKTLDRLTGEVVRQLPREEVMRLRDDAGYNAGRVVDTRA